MRQPAAFDFALTCPAPTTFVRARSLQGNSLGPQGAASLAEGLRGNSTLESLEYATCDSNRPLSVLPFCQRPLTRLPIHSCSTVPFLTYLWHPCSLRGSNIHGRGMHAIGNALLDGAASSLSALECDAFNVPLGAANLELSKKGLGAAAAILLAGMIKGNTSIISLK